MGEKPVATQCTSTRMESFLEDISIEISLTTNCVFEEHVYTSLPFHVYWKQQKLGPPDNLDRNPTVESNILELASLGLYFADMQALSV